ncbi:hypothetical protein RRF57_004798 [Xylaria bambusicola]|uniref:Uncharacterized protein n=1 Tax=Xylaria bambusicola TaxID=326684 RepID=A0AAN7UGZ5_9PEZI
MYPTLPNWLEPQLPLEPPSMWSQGLYVPPLVHDTNFFEVTRKAMQPGSGSRLTIKFPHTTVTVGVNPEDWRNAVMHLRRLASAIEAQGLTPRLMDLYNPATLIPREDDKTNNNIVITLNDKKEKNNDDSNPTKGDNNEKSNSSEPGKKRRKEDWSLFKKEMKRETKKILSGMQTLPGRVKELESKYNSLEDDLEAAMLEQEEEMSDHEARIGDIKIDLGNLRKEFEELKSAKSVPAVPTVRRSDELKKSPYPSIEHGPSTREFKRMILGSPELPETGCSDVKGKSKEKAVDSRPASIISVSSVSIGEAGPSMSPNLFADTPAPASPLYSSPPPPLVVNGTTPRPETRTHPVPHTHPLPHHPAAKPISEPPMYYGSPFLSMPLPGLSTCDSMSNPYPPSPPNEIMNARVQQAMNNIQAFTDQFSKVQDTKVQDGESQERKVQDDKHRSTSVKKGEDQKKTEKKDCCCDDDDNKDQDGEDRWERLAMDTEFRSEKRWYFAHQIDGHDP